MLKHLLKRNRTAITTSRTQSKRAVNRRARQNKTPNTRSNLEMVRVGDETSSRPGILQPRFPLPQSLDNKVYDFIQTLVPSVIASSNIANTFTSFNFQLSQLDQAASFQALFDQYRIRMIEVNFIPAQTEQPTPVINQGNFYTVVDYDDSNALTSVAAAVDYTNVQFGTGTQQQRRVFQPHVAVAAYSGAFTSFENQASPWIDMQSPNVQHYGVKTVWTPTNSNGDAITVLSRIWLQCRNVR